MNKKRKKLKGMILNLEKDQLQPLYKITLYSVISEHIYTLYFLKKYSYAFAHHCSAIRSSSLEMWYAEFSTGEL